MKSISLLVPIHVVDSYSEIATKMCIRSIILSMGYTERDVEVLLLSDNNTREFNRYLKFVIKYGSLENHSMKLIELGDGNKVEGLPRVLNVGIEKSTGYYIAEVDNDVIVPKNWISSLISFFEKGEYSIVSALDYYSMPTVPNPIQEILSESNYRMKKYAYLMKKEDVLLNDLFLILVCKDLDDYAENVYNHLKNYTTEHIKSAHWLTTKDNLDLLKALDGYYYDEKYGIGMVEDSDLLHRMEMYTKKKGVATGSCFVHHFGNITMKKMRGYDEIVKRNKEYFYSKFGFYPNR